MKNIKSMAPLGVLCACSLATTGVLASDTGKVLDEVSVTATRETRSTGDVPQAIAVVGKEALADKKMFNVKEALQEVPGVLIEAMVYMEIVCSHPNEDCMMSETTYEDIATEEHEGLRLDVYLAGQLEDASRSFVKKLIKEGRVLLNGQPCTRPARILAVGDAVATELPPPPATDLVPEDIPLDILYQDADVVVVNKQSGLVVHPAPGHYAGTLVHALLFHCTDFQRSGSHPDRPGIVHRLDRDTSGVLVVAKTPRAFLKLAEQAREHTFDRRYLALVRGEFEENTGRIVANVGRSMVDRKRMSVTGVHGREAVTRFEVLERFDAASLIALRLETGRTHQIRVHLRFAGHSVLGDPVYGVTDYAFMAVSEEIKAALGELNGQALHAERLGFEHPTTGEQMVFTAPLPVDFQNALDTFRAQHAG